MNKHQSFIDIGQRILCKVSLPTDTQTDRQTNRQTETNAGGTTTSSNQLDYRASRVNLDDRLVLHATHAVVQLVEYWTHNQEVAGSTHTRSTASNLEQVANLLPAQANSASYLQRDGK